VFAINLRAAAAALDHGLAVWSTASLPLVLVVGESPEGN
jgi:hypothetical protein